MAISHPRHFHLRQLFMLIVINKTIMPNVIMMNVIMLNVIMLNVMAPNCPDFEIGRA